MRKCWYCGKEIENENDKEHIGICGKCYYTRHEVEDKLFMEVIKEQTDRDQKIADLKTKLIELQREMMKSE